MGTHVLAGHQVRSIELNSPVYINIMNVNTNNLQFGTGHDTIVLLVLCME